MAVESSNPSSAHLEQKIAKMSEDRERDSAAALARLTALETRMEKHSNDLCVGLNNRFVALE